MSTIRETVRVALSEEGAESYIDQAAAATAIIALENREDQIVTKIRQFAAARTWRDDLVEDFLEGVGLAEPTPEPEPVSTEREMTVEERLDHLVGVTTTLTDMITRLVNAASRNGITV